MLMRRHLIRLGPPHTPVSSAQVHAAFMAALQFGYAELVSADEYLAAGD